MTTRVLSAPRPWRPSPRRASRRRRDEREAARTFALAYLPPLPARR